MTGIAPDMTRLDLAPQRAMFALEFVDPISRRLVAEGLRVTADGLRPPTVTPSDRFVWLDRDPPADRRIKVQAVSVDGMYAPFEELIHVPAHVGDVPASALTFRRDLRPTGLYDPPPGMSAVGGMLVEEAGARAPVAGVRIRIQFRYAEGMETFTSPHAALTDPAGGFIAVVGRLGDVRPDPVRKSPGTFAAWLMLERGEEVRLSPPMPLRAGRLNRIPNPVEWTALLPPELE